MTTETSNARGEWVLVPREPTPEMLAATSWPGCAASDYAHMLAAAPQPPSAPVGVKTLSEFMAEQEALHPGIHDKVQAATDELRASLAQQPAAVGEEIMVNAAHDVFTLPLQPSGLSSGPRFVVHVPAPEQQPAAVDEAMVERIAALLHEEATAEPWTVAGVEHPGPDRDYYRGLARKIADIATKQQGGSDDA